MTNLTIRQMLEAGVHFGHQARFWNPKMAPYIFGANSKIHIIDLEKTLPLYKQAVNFLSSVAAKKGKILFVATKQQARSLIRDEAKRCSMPYVDFRWLGGMLTNYKTIRQSLKRLKELEDLRDSVTFARMSKKEALSIMRDITKLEKSLGGIRDMGGLPDALFVIDVGIKEVKPGAHLGNIGAAIQKHAKANKFSIVREYCGHGIGATFHEPPQVLHYGEVGTGEILEPGMIFTIEPMINAGAYQTILLDDGWTAITVDHKLSAQWEHTVLVTETGHEVLTKRKEESFEC